MLTLRCLAWALIALPTATYAAGPTPLQDDAALHDVQFVGTQIGWCVGDHGTIWKTVDGGRTWNHVPSPVPANLHSVCFLTDRVGWIAGGGVRSHTRQSFGVVLFTEDGGASWRVGVDETWPNLQYVRFFSLEDGIAVGEATRQCPTGLMTSSDGGQTWQPVAGEFRPGWRTAEFLRPEIGALGGARGQVALAGGGRLLATQVGNLGLRTVRQIRLTQDDTGWFVGDGGMVRTTVNGGVSWTPPPGPLPQELANCLDFHAVAVHGPNVWIAGRPGSVVWHSADNGTTWRQYPTGQTVPIHDLEFISEQVGWAVGAMGTVLSTTDGGQTWTPIRGNGRRAAFVAFMPRPERISFSLLTTLGGGEGYRGIVHLPARESGTDDFDLRVHESVAAVGGNGAEFDWRFPLTKPEIETRMERLVTDWNDRNEGRFADVFLGSLVLSLRTWRPEVVVVDTAGENDAVGRLLFDAIPLAVQQAADPARFPAHQQLAKLSPHAVRRVFYRQPDGSVGHVHIDPHEYLSRLGTTAHTAAASARSRLTAAGGLDDGREAYRLLSDSGSQSATPGFFSGIDVAPGSASRRLLPLVDPTMDARRQQVFQRQRNFQAYAARMLDDRRHAAQVISQLRQLTEGLTDREAALQLAELAADYRRRSRWDLVEATLVELVERFPQEPAAVDAMRWLFQLWSSDEAAWQRAQETQVQSGQIVTDVADVRGRIERALAVAQNPALQQAAHVQPAGPDPVQLLLHQGQLRTGRSEEWRGGAVRNWQEQAIRMAALLRQAAPALYASPEVQFPLASLMQKRGTFELSDRVYGQFAAKSDSHPWKSAAASEIWLQAPAGQPPKDIAPVLPVRQKPLLDGMLSDDCWQAAKILTLQSTSETTGERASGGAGFVMLAYDSEFLYYAASLPKSTEVTYDPVQLAGRQHDEDLSGRDRVQLLLDTDRDYATWYTLEVDQRGQTREACWDDSAFDPKWFVAVEADEQRWRIEAAIPWKQFTPTPPTARTVWAVGMLRTVPGVGLESWTLPATETPRPEVFGLVQFQ